METNKNSTQFTAQQGPQRLDNFSKIILATGTINYLASSIEGVNAQMKMIKGDGFKELTGKLDDDLEKATKLLTEVMEVLGNSLPETCSIDQYVTTPAFMVVMHGHDEVEGDFDNL